MWAAAAVFGWSMGILGPAQPRGKGNHSGLTSLRSWCRAAKESKEVRTKSLRVVGVDVAKASGVLEGNQ